MWTALQDRLAGILDLGGPVVALLMALSVLSLAVILYKLWQFGAAGVGRHRGLRRALEEIDRAQPGRASATLRGSRSHLAPVLLRALEAPEEAAKERIEAEAAARLDRLETGFRILDSIAQIAPLLGLFGTVLGMIDAFQALQDAGASVDPSTLAGGIWVALLTTAAGLAVSMPTTLLLTFLESRVARERALAEIAVETLFAPLPERASAPLGSRAGAAAHAG
ncbi:MotA/TolQ/ExbB proton channel family protein [Psychromarinibacter sp. C21-152]|uniref:MotA/TolQ/ExbB proton channel family protein n=1 Tax=Psychromarinibacter sediminicola TaxID=3033385 RepID=A0AAE3NWG3_9RHOB|nr:MotA/TolQ/ExbB proton channel family protein [Psychromarinibacter sediminicola]MDF0603286.1 MotA/TolQ/ExbB proton channel family protein [Psychromarinibacter sediminicola]